MIKPGNKSLKWKVLMAYRDGKRSIGKLILIVNGIILGIAALVAINSFSASLQKQVNDEAKAMLGADIEVTSRNSKVPEDVFHLADSLGMEISEEIRFASMAYFPKTGDSRLVNIRAVENTFPFYGEIETSPMGMGRSYNSEKTALAEQSLMKQFKAQPGDMVRVGSREFKISAAITKVPGQSDFQSSIAPPVYIPMSELESTGLIKFGSRITYKVYLKYPKGFDYNLFTDLIKPRLDKLDVGYDDVEERKQELGEAFNDLGGFLNLTAFIALLLGCLGVGSSIHSYLKEKNNQTAILRCLGATGRTTMQIYLIQILSVAFIGSLVGTLLGVLLQSFLPLIIKDFIPIDIAMEIHIPSIFAGIATGVIVTLLFAMIPLIKSKHVSPLQAIRSFIQPTKIPKIHYLLYFLLILFVFLFTFYQMGSAVRAIIFTMAIMISFGILWLVAQGIIFLIKRFFPKRSSFIWRQGLANLFRPNNQTTALIMSAGLGTALLCTIYLTQDLLISKVNGATSGERPSIVAIDIQTSQLDSLETMTKENGLPIINSVPIVTIKLHSIKDRPIVDIEKDTASGIKDWVLNREYRVTYRDHLINSEEVVEGEFTGIVKKGDPVKISLDERIAEDMKVEVGDKLTFNVQGAYVETVVGSLRKVDWQRMQTNFLVVFPEGVLENAPKFHVLLTRAETPEETANFRNMVSKTFPNISIIDLNLIINTLENIVDKISYIVYFMAWLCILTGVMVLYSSIRSSKDQRLRENVLLRTIGANKKQVRGIVFTEYLILGSLSAFTGVLIAILATWLLSYFSFETDFNISVLPIILVFLIISSLIILIGVLNSRSATKSSPLEVLRTEAV
ncbi:ABC transporter permease [Marinigracilibium pacificum]|uniref:FtsX-like permease family protein n=1 Tax=Marinigracilibium pacificum TaxID=2729599 RepID=A0A848IXZ4_9BACT|nr:FtsX-like permease family protein [Marinigracilibium pacificum]NMM48155.1 FtsX-like permease family protein [Marinigracilibium pacificum]